MVVATNQAAVVASLCGCLLMQYVLSDQWANDGEDARTQRFTDSRKLYRNLPFALESKATTQCASVRVSSGRCMPGLFRSAPCICQPVSIRLSMKPDPRCRLPTPAFPGKLNGFPVLRTGRYSTRRGSPQKAAEAPLPAT